MLVTQFCEERVGGFPDEFYESLPEFCDECGFPLEMSEALTQLHCSNPHCTNKVVQRMVAIAGTLGIKDLGESVALKICRLGITNPLAIFMLEETDEIEGVSQKTIKHLVDQISSRNKFTLSEYVKIANIPGVQMSAFHLFEGYDDLEEAYKAIEEGKVDYIQKRLDIKTVNGTSIRAIKVYDALMTYKDELFQALPYVEIIKINTPDITTLKAVCSSDVGSPFRTKADFYATCNKSYPGVHVEFGNAVTSTTQYLIWAGANGNPAPVTNKVKKARALIDKGQDIKIMTALDFIALLDRMGARATS